MRHEALPMAPLETTNYGRISLLKLADLIVHNSDQCALRELHDNRVIVCGKNEQRFRMAEYISIIAHKPLALQWCGYDEMALDQAYDLTISKFLNIPTAEASNNGRKRQGPDCRYYFSAFIKYTTTRLLAEGSINTIREEILSAEILRNLVARHFFLSCLESKRQAQKLVRRYLWKLNGHTLYIWLPTEVPGRLCRKWLDANIFNVDPSRAGEQERVQTIVDRLLMMPRVISINEIDGGAKNIPARNLLLSSMVQEEMLLEGLAGTVANEKVDNINRQRPAIRSLGNDKLRELICRIFTNLVSEDNADGSTATYFGLSKATFSRFAGSHWKGHDADMLTNHVPDLWRNTSHILAGHPDFVTAAQKAGVWKRVSKISLEDNQSGRTKK